MALFRHETEKARIGRLGEEAALALLKKAEFSDGDFLFVLGDVIDRGEHGITLLRWMAEQPNVQLILGNHEAMLMACKFLFDEVTEITLDATDEGRRLYETLGYRASDEGMYFDIGR